MEAWKKEAQRTLLFELFLLFFEMEIVLLQVHFECKKSRDCGDEDLSELFSALLYPQSEYCYVSARSKLLNEVQIDCFHRNKPSQSCCRMRFKKAYFQEKSIEFLESSLAANLMEMCFFLSMNMELAPGCNTQKGRCTDIH